MTYGTDAPGFAWPELTPAIKRLLLVNVAVFLLNALLGGTLSEGPAWFGFSGPGLADGYGLGVLRIVTYQFTHSFHSVQHIVMNMLVLYFFGTMAERSLGYRGTYKLYLLGGAFAALVHFGMAALLGYADVPLVGASGACYAFLVYAACVAPRSTVILIIVPMPLAVLAGLLVFFGVYSQYVELREGSTGSVAHSAHLAGAAFGFCCHRLGWLRDFTPYVFQGGAWAAWRQRLRGRRDERRVREATADQQELDRILAKIQQQGMPSLSSRERRTLARASERAKRK